MPPLLVERHHRERIVAIARHVRCGVVLVARRAHAQNALVCHGGDAIVDRLAIHLAYLAALAAQAHVDNAELRHARMQFTDFVKRFQQDAHCAFALCVERTDGNYVRVVRDACYAKVVVCLGAQHAAHVSSVAVCVSAVCHATLGHARRKWLVAIVRHVPRMREVDHVPQVVVG